MVFSSMYLVLYSNRYVVIDVIKLLIVDVDSGLDFNLIPIWC